MTAPMFDMTIDPACRVDTARVDALEQHIRDGAAQLGFAIDTFQVQEDRSGQSVPVISLILHQGPVVDRNKAEAFFLMQGAHVVRHE